jgi:hypothetical protein
LFFSCFVWLIVFSFQVKLCLAFSTSYDPVGESLLFVDRTAVRERRRAVRAQAFIPPSTVIFAPVM